MSRNTGINSEIVKLENIISSLKYMAKINQTITDEEEYFAEKYIWGTDENFEKIAKKFTPLFMEKILNKGLDQGMKVSIIDGKYKLSW